MKHRIIFVILLVLIIIAGLNGTKITAALLGGNDMKESSISRSPGDSGAIYLSQEDIHFDPMSMVSKETSQPFTEADTSTLTYGYGRFDICDIMYSLVRNISKYSSRAAFVTPGEVSFRDSVYITDDGFCYVEKYLYYNEHNNKRYVDIIMDSDDMSIRYINFYDGQKHSVSPEIMERGTEQFNNMLTEFYARLSRGLDGDWCFGKFSNVLEDDYGIITFNACEPDIPDYIVKSNGFDNICDLYISDVCHGAINGYESIGLDNPMDMFFMPATAPGFLYLIDTVYDDIEQEYDVPMYVDEYDAPPIYGNEYEHKIHSAMNFTAECMTSDFVTNQEYAAYNGRIYVTINTRSGSRYEKKVIIYNVLTNEIEGYCNTYSTESWGA